ncbi:MAG TPA: hypothetical protein VEK11_19430 [Thermoanaerobaculia bacterium]|nr:hypothetical protein [Thermoanaerobaculia bacterium]
MTSSSATGPFTPTATSSSRAPKRARLEPKAMELLVRLAASPGTVVTKEELLRDV